jgi:hypothetical protein
MIRRFTVAVAFAAVSIVSIGSMLGITARPANAQVKNPDYWVGLSIGYMEGITTTDDATGATWQFGYTGQIRATLEKTLQRGTTVGIAAGFANAPLTYTSGSFGGCGQCQATANVTQYTIFVQGGGGGSYGGFHGLYTLETGVTQFSDFQEKSSGADLQPGAASYDATFGLGGGVGYTLSPTADLYVGEMVDFVLHHQSSAVAAQSAPRFFTLRAGFRVGF